MNASTDHVSRPPVRPNATTDVRTAKLQLPLNSSLCVIAHNGLWIRHWTARHHGQEFRAWNGTLVPSHSRIAEVAGNV